MALVATETSSAAKIDYPAAPQGLHRAVCVEVRDLGMVESTWKNETKTRPMVMLAFELEPEYQYETKDGETVSTRHKVFSRYTLTLSPMGNLRPVVESLIGRELSEAEAKSGFDLEQLEGCACQVQVSHREWNGKTRDNVKAVVPAGEDKLEPSGTYGANRPSEDPVEDNSDIPF